MLMMFSWPIFARNSLTTLSKLSCPSSMQSVRRMVLTRSFFSVSLAATSSGGGGFWMSTSVGASCAGTLKCFSSRAAAEVAMGLTTLTVAGSGSGMVMEWAQAGHWILVPARLESASSSCLQLGQTNVTSIKASRLELNLPEPRASPPGILAKILLVRLLQLFDARVNRRIGAGPLSHRGEDLPRLLWIAGADQHDVVQFDGSQPGVVHVAPVHVEPVLQAGGALALRRLKRGLQVGGQSRQDRRRRRGHRGRRRPAAVLGLLSRLDLLPVAIEFAAAPEGGEDEQDADDLSHDSSTRSMRAPSRLSFSSIRS